MAANGMTVPGANKAALEAVTTGEVGALVAGVDYNAYSSKAKGAPVDIYYPAGGTIVNPRPAMILKTAPNMDNAKLFIDYLFSDEAQKLVADAYVVTDKELIGQLSEASPYAKCAKEAPVVFVPCFRSEGIAPEYFNIDMSAAVENLLLEADTLGLGAVWMGISPDEGRMEAVRKVLDIPTNLNAFALVPCGYPAEEREQENRYEESRIHYR